MLVPMMVPMIGKLTATPIARRGLHVVLVTVLALVGSVLIAARPASAHPVPTKPIKVVTVHSGKHTYVLKIWAKRSSGDCAAHAYGKVKTFLEHHTCGGLA